MTDTEFIGYCEIHSQTERALFNGPQVARLMRLAGKSHDGNVDLAAIWESRGSQYWRSLDLSDLCVIARCRLDHGHREAAP